MGEPDRIEKIGSTEIPYPIFLDYILNLGETRYKKGSYDLRQNNGIHFVDDVAQFVCSIAIPKYLLHLPHIVFETPLGDEEVIPLLDRVSERGQTIGEGIQRSQNFLLNYVPKTPGQIKELSPDLLELQAEIDAIRANKKYLDERRSKAITQADDSDENIEEVQCMPRPELERKNLDLLQNKKTENVSVRKKSPIKQEYIKSSLSHELSINTTQNIKQKEEILPDNLLSIDDVNTESCSKKPNLLIPEEQGCDCDQNNKPVDITPTAADNLKQLETSNDTKEKRVTFVVINQNCDIEEKENSEAFPDLPALQEVLPLTSNLQKELLHQPTLEQALVAENFTWTSDLDQDSKKGTEGEEIIEEFCTQKENSAKAIINISNEQKVQTMADQETNGNVAAEGQPPAGEDGADTEVVERPKKNQTPSEPPITFREFNHTKDFEDLVRTVVTMLSVEEQDRLREMEDWIIKNEGTWVLAEGFNAFLGRILHEREVPSETRIAMIRLLAFGAAQDDIVLILHMDRKDHLVMNYAQEFDRLPILEQESLALFFANLFETNSSSEWLLYISEWTQGNMGLSNIRVTTKVAVNALLGDTPTLQNYGSAIMHNLATKEVFDDVCSELAMAILQFFQGKPPEEQVFRCMKALNKFCTIAHREVPQLVKMIGPEPSKFSGMSARIDTFIESINARLATVPSF